MEIVCDFSFSFILALIKNLRTNWRKKPFPQIINYNYLFFVLSKKKKESILAVL